MNIYLKSKITLPVTGSEVEYEGSLTLDIEIMEKLKVKPYEQVYINARDTDTRIMTYLLAGERGSGICEANGGAAKFLKIGDVVHLLFFHLTDNPENPVIL